MKESEWDRQASTYDQLNEDLNEPVIDALAAMLEGERVLELGCGTGRVAIPLAQRGLSVAALDFSEGMLDEFRRKLAAPEYGGLRTSLIHRRMQEYSAPATFDSIVCVNNGLLFVLEPEAQVEVLRRIQENLADGGCAVIHVSSPASIVQNWGLGRNTRPGPIGDDHSIVMSAVIDLFKQRVDILYEYLPYGGPPWYVTSRMRFIWLNELFVMAELAGLHVENVTGGWDGRPAGSGVDLILKLRAAGGDRDG